jgi:hypothetical protein
MRYDERGRPILSPEEAEQRQRERLKKIREMRLKLQREGHIPVRRRGGRRGVPNVSGEHPIYMSRAQVLEFCGLKISELRNAIRNGELPYERIGKFMVFRRRIVMRWLNERDTKKKEEA